MSYQKAYDKKCEELGLKKMEFRETPKRHFSSIDAGVAMKETKEQNKKQKTKSREKVLISKTLLEELIEKLDSTYDFTDIETIEELREAL